MPDLMEPHGADISFTMYSGSKTLWKERTSLDLTIASHFNTRILEVVCYNPLLNVEYPRIYIDAIECKKSGLDQKAFHDELTSRKEAFIRNHKTFDEDRLIDEIIHAMMIDYIISRVGLVPATATTSAASNSVSLLEDTTTPRLLKDAQFIAALIPKFNDGVLDDEPQTLRSICNRPKKLLPVQIKNMKVASHGEVDIALHRIELERFQLNQATALANVATGGFKAVLEKKRELAQEHCKVRRRWQLAIRRVLVQNYVKAVIERLMNSSFRGWYLQLLRKQREMEENTAEEKRQDEIARQLRKQLWRKQQQLLQQQQTSPKETAQSRHHHRNSSSSHHHSRIGNKALRIDTALAGDINSELAASSSQPSSPTAAAATTAVTTTAATTRSRVHRYTIDNSGLQQTQALAAADDNKKFMNRLNRHRHHHNYKQSTDAGAYGTVDAAAAAIDSPSGHSRLALNANHLLPRVENNTLSIASVLSSPSRRRQQQQQQSNNGESHLPLIDVSFPETPGAAKDTFRTRNMGLTSSPKAATTTANCKGSAVSPVKPTLNRVEQWTDGTVHHSLLSTHEYTRQQQQHCERTGSIAGNRLGSPTKHCSPSTLTHRPLEDDPFFKKENRQVLTLSPTPAATAGLIGAHSVLKVPHSFENSRSTNPPSYSSSVEKKEERHCNKKQLPMPAIGAHCHGDRRVPPALLPTTVAAAEGATTTATTSAVRGPPPSLLQSFTHEVSKLDQNLSMNAIIIVDPTHHIH